MSAPARPDLAAFRELESLVRHLGDELAGFRRRALTAEGRLRDLEAEAGGEAPPAAELTALRERVAELETENAAMRGRLDDAAGRARQMLDRVRFLRQQAQVADRGGDR